MAGSGWGNRNRPGWPSPPNCAAPDCVWHSPRSRTTLSRFAFVEVTAQPLPALRVVTLQLRRHHRIARGTNDGASFKHKGHRVPDGVRSRCIRAYCLFEAGSVRAVSRHAVVKRRPAGSKAVRLGVVNAGYQSHELTRDIAMKPRQPERVFHDEPARREYHEIEIVDTRGVADRLQHEKNGGIGVIVADRADGVEQPQVVFVRRVVAVPGDDVLWRMID